MKLEREGIFLATIGDHGVNETGKNNLATFIAQFKPYAVYVDGQFVSLDPEEINAGLETTGYFYLEKTDGSINDSTVKQLKTSLGWDGRDPMWLQDADLAVVVQITIKKEIYQNKEQYKVSWINAEDATPTGVQKADDATRQKISMKLGARFRAMAGGSPAPAPKPSGKPTPPPRPAPPPPVATEPVEAVKDADIPF